MGCSIFLSPFEACLLHRLRANTGERPPRVCRRGTKDAVAKASDRRRSARAERPVWHERRGEPTARRQERAGDGKKSPERRRNARGEGRLRIPGWEGLRGDRGAGGRWG